MWLAHLLQGADNLSAEQKGPLGIAPEDMSDAVWDFIFLGGELPKSSIPEESLKLLRKEFQYW